MREMLRAELIIQLRLIRSWLLLLVNSIPVDAREPGMRHDLFCVGGTRAESGSGVFVQELGANISSVVTQEAEIKSWVAIFDVSEKLFFIFTVEGRLSAKHFIDYSSEGPPIGSFSVTLIEQNLWCKILCCSTNTFSFIMSENVLFRKAEICNFDVSIMAH